MAAGKLGGVSFNSAALQLMLEKGLTLEDVVQIAAANEPARSSAAARQQRYRDRKDVDDSEWYALRERVFIRDGFRCTYCGYEEDLSCDHVIPLVQGGKSTMDNLTTACRSCNCAKSGRTPEQWQSQ